MIKKHTHRNVSFHSRSGHRSAHSRSDAPHRSYNVVFIIAVIVAFAAGAFALSALDKREITYDAETLEKEAAVLSDVVDVGGIPCVPKKNIRSYLIMGIDNTAERGENYVLGGQCDVLVLLVVDYTDKTYQLLPINRNTITDVRWYDMDGEYIGTDKIQIAFAHAVGDGGTFSCENAVDAVSNYLGGVDIENYIALEMEAIPKINRLAGGVTVTIEDDFTSVDPTLVKGQTITLTDDQAVTFVRARMNMEDDDTNEARMRRQQAFLDSMRAQMLEKAKEDGSYAVTVYDTLEPDMVTNMNGKAFSRLVNGLTECEDLGSIAISGSVGVSDLGYASFEADGDSVRDAVIEMFYRRAEDAEMPSIETDNHETLDGQTEE